MLCERFTFDALHHCGLKVFTLLFVQRVNASTRSRDAYARSWRKFCSPPLAPSLPSVLPQATESRVLRINFFRSFMIGSSRFVPRFHFVSFLDRFNVRFILISRFSANLIPPRISTNRLAFLLFSSYFLVVKKEVNRNESRGQNYFLIVSSEERI